jgi:hypothetical protein
MSTVLSLRAMTLTNSKTARIFALRPTTSVSFGSRWGAWQDPYDWEAAKVRHGLPQASTPRCMVMWRSDIRHIPESLTTAELPRTSEQMLATVRDQVTDPVENRFDRFSRHHLLPPACWGPMAGTELCQGIDGSDEIGFRRS